jgi:hypothetical protein
MKRACLLIVFSILSLPSANTFPAGVSEQPLLRTNPFNQPNLMAGPGEQAVAAGKESDPADMVLKGTLVAGSDPMANISGVILEIGDEVNGHRLVSVGEWDVILEKDGVRKMLTVYNE